jgi:hypothetical protein
MNTSPREVHARVMNIEQLWQAIYLVNQWNRWNHSSK